MAALGPCAVRLFPEFSPANGIARLPLIRPWLWIAKRGGGLVLAACPGREVSEGRAVAVARRSFAGIAPVCLHEPVKGLCKRLPGLGRFGNKTAQQRQIGR